MALLVREGEQATFEQASGDAEASGLFDPSKRVDELVVQKVLLTAPPG